MFTKDPANKRDERSLEASGWIARCLMAVLDASERLASAKRLNKAVRDLSLLDDAALEDLGLTRASLKASVYERAESERNNRYGW